MKDFSKLYIKYFISFMNGNYNDLANATKLVSKLCLVYRNPDTINGSNAFMNVYEDPKMTKYIDVDIELKDITKYKLNQFCKNLQKPYLPFLFYPKFMFGSCHDVAVIKTILNLKQKKQICVKLYKGRNKMMSHINSMACSVSIKTEINLNEISFVLLSLFHVYRTYEIIDDKNKKKFKKQITKTVEQIIDKNHVKYVIDFLFTRTFAAAHTINPLLYRV